MNIDALRNRFDQAIKERINEVARVATDLEKDNPGIGRTEALRLAEDIVPQVTA